MRARSITIIGSWNGNQYIYIVEREKAKKIAIRKLRENKKVVIKGNELKPTIEIEAADLLRMVKTDELSQSIIPHKLSEYVTDLTTEYSMRPIMKIDGRDNELERIWFYLSQKTRNNVFLVGDADVGKTTIANEIVREIATNECPKEFYDYRVIQVNVEEIVNRTNKFAYFNKISLIEKLLTKYKKNIVLYIDNAFYWKTTYEFMNLLNLAISVLHIPVIATERVDNFEEYFLNDSIISKYLNYVYIEEPELEEIEPILSRHIKHLEKKYSISISQDMIKFAIFTSGLSNTKSANPGRAENVLERAFLEAKRKNRKEVCKDNILSCYDSYTKLYNSFSEDSKKITAFHEAGHYVVTVMCKHIKDEKIAFVSILPMMDFLGVNWSYRILGENINHTKTYFIEQIAVCLGGRVAEKHVTSEESTGASSDLYQANKIAEEMIMAYGLETKNRTYVSNEGYPKGYIISEKRKQEIDDQIQKYIDEGSGIAEKIISENLRLVELIANVLLKEEILTGEELEKIVEDYKEKH